MEAEAGTSPFESLRGQCLFAAVLEPGRVGFGDVINITRHHTEKEAQAGDGHEQGFITE